MISKEDFEKYLDQVRSFELKMFNSYKMCAEQVEDEYIRKVCQGLFKAELNHAQTLKEITEIIKQE